MLLSFIFFYHLLEEQLYQNVLDRSSPDFQDTYTTQITPLRLVKLGELWSSNPQSFAGTFWPSGLTLGFATRLVLGYC